jgi:hypothetical protein
MPERKPLPVIVLIWSIVGLVSTATMFGFVIDAPHLLLLERQHADTVGRVIRLIPESHGQVEIEYSAAGVTYRQAVTVYGVPTPVVAGQTVLLYYYPQDPVIAFTAPPEEVLADQGPFWVMFSGFGAFCGGLAAAINREAALEDSKS